MNQRERKAYKDLGKSLSLVYDGLSITGKALILTSNPEEERKLVRVQARLELERADIVAARNAIRRQELYGAPTAAQVTEIANLSAEVEALTNQALSASAGLALAGRILTIASKVGGTDLA